MWLPLSLFALRGRLGSSVTAFIPDCDVKQVLLEYLLQVKHCVPCSSSCLLPQQLREVGLLSSQSEEETVSSGREACPGSPGRPVAELGLEPGHQTPEHAINSCALQPRCYLRILLPHKNSFPSASLRSFVGQRFMLHVLIPFTQLLIHQTVLLCICHGPGTSSTEGSSVNETQALLGDCVLSRSITSCLGHSVTRTIHNLILDRHFPMLNQKIPQLMMGISNNLKNAL